MISNNQPFDYIFIENISLIFSFIFFFYFSRKITNLSADVGSIRSIFNAENNCTADMKNVDIEETSDK